MDQQDYFILWSVYLCAAFVLVLASIFFTSFLWRFLKEPIVIVVVILLFYPTIIDPEKAQYAPAIAVMAVDFVMHVGEHEIVLADKLFYIIKMTLIGYFIFALFIRWPIEFFVRKWWRNRQQKEEYYYQNNINDQDNDVEQQNTQLQASERL